MCAKCQAMQNTYLGRYGALIQEYQNGTYHPEAVEKKEESLCESKEKSTQEMK